MKAVTLAKKRQKDEEEKKLKDDEMGLPTVEEKRKTNLKAEINLHAFELMFPSNIYSRAGTILKIYLKTFVSVDLGSIYNDISYMSPTNVKKLKESILIDQETDCKVAVQNLSMFIESNEDFENDTGSQYSEKSYLLYPYDIGVHL